MAVSEITERNIALYKLLEPVLDFDDFVTLTSAVVESGYFDKFENTINLCAETGNKDAMYSFVEAQMDKFKII